MELREILSHLERNEGHFPRVAVREAIAHRKEIVPALLEVLENVARDPDPFASDADRMIQIYAMYLVAQFRETRAYPLLVQIFSTPGELAFDLVGDLVTEGLDRILASVSDGDIDGITSLVENEHVNEYVRSAAMDGLLALVSYGKRSREEVIAYFGSLFHKLDPAPSMVWNSLASACADLCAKELLDDIRWAYEEDIVDPGFISWEDIEELFAAGEDAAMEMLKDRYPPVTDVAQEMECWACFHG